MNREAPLVSVVIPAYNQENFLGASIQSVLNQSYQKYEIIVVDDGSTDATPAAARQFGATVRYIQQENRGLAGARNTGIVQACGEYVALLDADDEWMPSYLEQMVGLALKYPEAAVYYCGVHYIDSVGALLPQPGQTRLVGPADMYRTVLRANFLIPSTVMMRHSVVQANLFDSSFRRLEDYELWLRLLRQGYKFAGCAQCMVRYRIHSSSLSTDSARMSDAMRAVLEKHFGADDSRWQTWTADKRCAYGGFYRYCALTVSLVRQGDWQACAGYLCKALQIDPMLALDIDLFYDLVLGPQSPGYRGDLTQIDIIQRAGQINGLLGTIFRSPLTPVLASVQRRARGTAYYALGLVAYNKGERALSRHFLLKALHYRPELWSDRLVVGNLTKSLAGATMMERIKLWRTRLNL